MMILNNRRLNEKILLTVICTCISMSAFSATEIDQIQELEISKKKYKTLSEDEDVSITKV